MLDRKRAATALLAAALLTLGACGDRDGGDQNGSDPSGDVEQAPGEEVPGVEATDEPEE